MMFAAAALSYIILTTTLCPLSPALLESSIKASSMSLCATDGDQEHVMKKTLHSARTIMFEHCRMISANPRMFSSSVKQRRQSAQSLRRIQPRLPETSSRSSTDTTRRSSTVSPRRIKELYLLDCRSRRSNAVAGARRNQALSSCRPTPMH
jgi:hypothetical protein